MKCREGGRLDFSPVVKTSFPLCFWLGLNPTLCRAAGMLVLAEPWRLWEHDIENLLKKYYVLLAALSSSYFSQTRSRARLKHKGGGGGRWRSNAKEEVKEVKYRTDDVFWPTMGKETSRRWKIYKRIQNFRQDPNKPAAHQHIALSHRWRWRLMEDTFSFFITKKTIEKKQLETGPQQYVFCIL